VAFDPTVDLAVVATDLDLVVLPTGTVEVGDSGLVLGFPGGGPLDPSPFAVGELLRARGLDIYDRAEVERSLVVLAAELAPGDSGSAVVRDDGRVVAVAVAIAPDRPGVAYALRVEDVLDDLGRVSGPVDTGECLA
jgi:S1-C subfamily serine protease